MRAAAALTVLLLASAPGPASAQGDAAIDARILASAEAAESLQGSLDGAWALVDADGAAIYAFQLVDKPSGTETPEGAWRDLRGPPTPGDIGLIDSLSRGPGTLTMSFVAQAGQPATLIVLKLEPDGAWVGELNEGGQTIAVTLKRG